MSVTFVIGRAGSGKTHRCFAAIVEALRADSLGPPIYWLLPRQATFTAERALTCASGLPGFCRARVVSFEQLGHDIFDECGGAAVPQVTEIGRQMILGHLLRELAPRLVYFGSVARQAGLAAELDRTFAELERAGKSAADLAALVDELEQTGGLDAEASALRDKLRDLHLIYNAYTSYLGQERLDQHRRLEQVLASVKNCSFIRRSTFYVDGFLEFTDFERRMLAAIAATGAKMEITLLMDPSAAVLRNPHLLPEEMGLFHRTETTYRKLWFAFNEADAEMGDPIVLETSDRFKNSPLREIEQHFVPLAASQVPSLNQSANPKSDESFRKQPAKPQAAAGFTAVHRIHSPDRETEVESVAREIQSLLALGYRLRDILILARDLSAYHALIDRIFAEHRIPYFVDRRRSAAHDPLLEFLRSALQIARFDWLGEAVFSLLKTGLAGVNADEADELENYCLLHRVRASAWESPQQWSYRRRLTIATEDEAASKIDTDRIDSIRRRVAEPLTPFVHSLRESKPLSVRALATAVFELFDRFNVRQTIELWMTSAAASSVDRASAIEQRDQHAQVWAELVELFEQMVDLLGEQTLTPADFVEVLESALERFDLGLTPPTVDQVLVGQADRTIAPPVRATIVLGLNAGQFPAAPRDHTVISDRERGALRERKMELDPDGNRSLLDERLLGYLAFTRGSERLIITRSAADEKGRTTTPSPYWHRLAEIVPSAQTTILPARHAEDIEQISTPRQLVTGVMRRTDLLLDLTPKSPASTDSADPWPALYQWIATDGRKNAATQPLLDRAWPALRYANNASIEESTNRLLFPAPLSATISQIETFAACPFRHFAMYALQLQSRHDSAVTMQDLGHIYHRVLEDLGNQIIGSRPDWNQDPLPITPEMIHAAVHKVGRTLRGELMLSSARNLYLLNRIEQTIGQLVESQKELMKRYRFRPTKAGLEFGDEANSFPPLALITPNGTQVFLHGKIDRVDTLSGCGDAVVLDYRMTAGPLSLAKVLHGLSLQLLGHLLVIEQSGQRLTGKPLKPAAAFQLQLLRSLGDVAHPDDALDPSDPRYLLALKPRGIFDSRCLPDLDAEVVEGFSQALSAFIKKDGGFGRRGTTDVADGPEFTRLLSHARSEIERLAERLLAGEISVAPYRLNRQSPCAQCEFRGVCRFETTVNQYHHLDGIGREQVLEKMRGEAARA